MSEFPDSASPLEDIEGWSRSDIARSWLDEYVASTRAQELWATWTLGVQRADPYWHERFRMPRGRRLGAAPAERAWSERVLLDAAAAPVYVEEYWSSGRAPEFREYVVADAGRVLSVRYARSWSVDGVYRVRRADGRIQSLEGRENGVNWVESYSYDGEGNVTAIEEPAERWPPDGLGWRDHGGQPKVTTGAHGRLQRIVNVTTGEQIYTAPVRPLEHMLAAFVDRLAGDVSGWMDVPDEEVVCSMALIYDDPLSIVPSVVLDTVQLRQTRLAHGGQALWTPDQPSGLEFEPPLDYDFAWFETERPLLEQELRLAGAPEPALAVLQALADRLNRGWEPPFRVAPDFVVYCLGHEGEEPAAVPFDSREF